MIPSMQINTAYPFIQGNHLYYLPNAEREKKPLSPIAYPLPTGTQKTLPPAALIGRANFLPNGCILAHGFPMDMNLIMYTPTEEDWTERVIFPNCRYVHLVFDSNGKIYAYQAGAQQLTCFTADGTLEWSVKTPKVSQNAFKGLVVVQGLVFFLVLWELVRYDRSSDTWTTINFTENIRGVQKIYTDYHHYLIIQSLTDELGRPAEPCLTHLTVLDLEGRSLRTILIGRETEDRQIVLHPNGDFYLVDHCSVDQKSDEVTIFTLRGE